MCTFSERWQSTLFQIFDHDAIWKISILTKQLNKQWHVEFFKIHVRHEVCTRAALGSPASVFNVSVYLLRCNVENRNSDKAAENLQLFF